MDALTLLKSYGEAWTYFGHTDFLVFMLLGMAAGILIGIIPALGASIVNVIFLAFVFMLNAEPALAFMSAVHAVSFTGGAVTTILLSIPGDSANAATLLDGAPMVKRGEAGRALGLAVAASGMGSVWSSVFALITIPVVIPLVMAVASPEMVFIILMGLTLIATLSRGSMLKGFISGFAGIFVGLIGYNIAYGVDRFTLGTIYLRDGIPIIPVFIGIFAIPEMVYLAATGGAMARHVAKVGSARQIIGGVKELFRHIRLNAVMSFIGYIIGIIPGIGGLVASWVAYGQTKQASKKSDSFGTGVAEGVIAPESANNAVASGAVLTTLALGVPGSAGCVLLMAAMIITGIVPGPEMLTQHLPFSISLLLITSVAGLGAAVICLLAAPALARIANVNGHILMPLLIVLVAVGVYVSEENFVDVIVVFVFGALGLAMKEFGFNQAPFILGFILGNLFEKYVFISFKAGGPMFFMRPLCLVLIAITIATVLMGYRTALFKKAKALDREAV